MNRGDAKNTPKLLEIHFSIRKRLK